MYEWISTIGAMIALISAAYTVFYARSQVRYSAITGPAQLVLQVDQVFLEYPLLRPYFYDAEPAPTTEMDPEMHHRVHAAAEFYVDVLEYCWASAEHYKKSARESYREWVHDVFAGSVVIQEFYLANEGWYPGLKGLRDSRLCSTASGHEFFTTLAGAGI